MSNKEFKELAEEKGILLLEEYKGNKKVKHKGVFLKGKFKDCECSVGGHFRQSELEIRRYGPVLPLTFTGMKMLTIRGVGLARNLSSKYLIKETHPRTAGKMLGFHHFETDIGEYLSIPPETNEHEIDAILAALCGYFYINNCYLELG